MKLKNCELYTTVNYRFVKQSLFVHHQTNTNPCKICSFVKYLNLTLMKSKAVFINCHICSQKITSYNIDEYYVKHCG